MSRQWAVGSGQKQISFCPQPTAAGVQLAPLRTASEQLARLLAAGELGRKRPG